MIVEDEQKGENRARYGQEVQKQISEQLTLEFGKGFDYTNLTNMRKFYLRFTKLDALRQELSWTHYRILSRVENAKDREQYMHLADDDGWNTRDLERNIVRLCGPNARSTKKKKCKNQLKLIVI